MQRRVNPQAATSTAAAVPRSKSSTERGRLSTPAASRRSVPLLFLIVAVLALTLLTLVLPKQNQHHHGNASDETNGSPNQKTRQAADQQQQGSLLLKNKDGTLNAASERMLQQDSSWVDGEKKLKEKLKVLLARQQDGHDLGVPVATRWVGDDIPVYFDAAEKNSDTVDDWNRRIQQRYDAMRIEEDEWKSKVTATLQSNGRG